MRMYYVDLIPRSKQFHLNPLDHPSWILKSFTPRSRVAHHPNCCPMSVKLYSTQRARIFADTVAVKILKKTRFKIPTPCAFQHNSYQAIKPCWVEQPEDYLHNACDSSPPPWMDFTFISSPSWAEIQTHCGEGWPITSHHYRHHWNICSPAPTTRSPFLSHTSL